MSAVPQDFPQDSLESALDQLLLEKWPPARWRRVKRASELPWRFEQLARNLPAGTWRAYADGPRLGFAVGEFVGEPVMQSGFAELAVSFYDSAGHICAAGIWSADAAGHWTLRETLD